MLMVWKILYLSQVHMYIQHKISVHFLPSLSSNVFFFFLSKIYIFPLDTIHYRLSDLF